MKFFIVLTSLTLVCASFKNPVSQEKEDSLFQAYSKAIYPSDKKKILWELIEETYNRDTHRCLKYSELYLKLCGQYGNDYDIANVCWKLGLLNKMLQNYDKAMEYYLIAINNYQKLKQDDNVASIYNNIGNVLMALNNYESAEEYFLKSIQINLKFKAFAKLVRNYHNLSKCELKRKRYDQSIEYLNTGIEFAKKLPSYRYINNLNNLIGSAYYYKEDYTRAREYYFKAIVYIDPTENKAYRLGIAYNNIGETYREQGDYNKALEFFEKAMVFKRQNGNDESTAITLINLSKLALLENKPEKAILYLEDTFNVLSEKPLYSQLKEASELLVEAYKNKTNFTKEDIDKILNLNKEYLRYIDELKLERNQKVSTLVINKDEIKDEAQYLQKKAKSIQKRSLWIIIIAVVVVLGLLILLYYREKRFKNFIKQMWEDIRDV